MERIQEQWCANCAEDRGDSCGERPCALQRQVPAAQGVRLESASGSVRRRLWTFLLCSRDRYPQCKPVVVQRQMRGVVVLKTVVVPQLQFIEGRRHLCRDAEADLPGPVCSEDHRDSPVAVL